jgi:membrane protease YdiL (CAAX protease family)
MSTVLAPTVQSFEYKPLKPMKLVESMVLFAIPAAALAASIWWLWPTLVAAGMARSLAYVLSLTIVNAGLLLAAVVGYRLEGNPLNLATFAKRMRLSSMTSKIWLWTIGSTLVFGILALLINSLALMIYKAIGLTIPDLATGVMTIWMHVVVLFFNIVGEELWWRGYILPRQELAHGKMTWLIHGTQWAFFHIFKWWAVPFMLITCQIIPYVAQKTKNTWPGMINHVIVNGVGLVIAAL